MAVRAARPVGEVLSPIRVAADARRTGSELRVPVTALVAAGAHGVTRLAMQAGERLTRVTRAARGRSGRAGRAAGSARAVRAMAVTATGSELAMGALSNTCVTAGAGLGHR
jgi:hypothetical protein